MADMCCTARDARHCTLKKPGRHQTPHRQLPDIYVPHYEAHCMCFSCRWVRETKCPFLESKTGQEPLPYPVANPTHDRVPQSERQRLLTRVPKNKFQIMSIFATQLEDKSWGWVVVLPEPLLPFLLTGEKYSGISRFARHPQDGWFGLKDDGERVDIDQEMVPPLYNHFYQHFGYDRQCSPYRLYRCPSEEDVSGNEASPSAEDQTASSTENEDQSSSEDNTPRPNEVHAISTPVNGSSPSAEDQAASSTENMDDSPSEDHTPQPNEVHATSTPVDGASSSAEVQASTPPEAQVSSSEPPTGQPTSDQDEWVVYDTRCANPPAASGACNENCEWPRRLANYNAQFCVYHRKKWFNTTIFVGGLNSRTTEGDLRHWFQGFGELMYVRKEAGATCGFVQYAGRKEADMAMSQMQGYPILGARLRLSWGNPQPFMDQKCLAHYRAQAWKAFKAYGNFKTRMSLGKARRDNDPDFWIY